MSVATFVVNEIERYDGTSKKTGKPFTKFAIKDGNGNIVGSTFDSALADAAESLKGARVEAVLEDATDPKYPPTVKSIKPAAVEPEPAAPMSKDEWRDKDFAIHLDSCIKSASASLTHTLKSEPSREDITNFGSNVLYLAHLFLDQIKKERGTPPGEAPQPGLSEADDNIPF